MPFYQYGTSFVISCLIFSARQAPSEKESILKKEFALNGGKFLSFRIDSFSAVAKSVLIVLPVLKGYQVP